MIFFRMPMIVGIRSVNQISARMQVGFNDLLGHLDARADAAVFAKSHGAEAVGADPQAQAAQRSIVGQREGSAGGGVHDFRS